MSARLYEAVFVRIEASEEANAPDCEERRVLYNGSFCE